MSKHLMDQPIRAMAAALRDGSTTSAALIDEAIDRHERFGSQLNAYKHWDPTRAKAEARAVDALLAAGHDSGPLMGLPISLKDLYGVRGMPIFAGSPKELPAKWRREGPVVAALRGQHAIVAGKTHTVEFAYGGVGTNAHWGAPRNPWDDEAHRVTGGSSSGAGVSLCQGSAVVAMGTDTGGSVRIPASVTGNVGLKVTIGRWSLEGIVPLSHSYDTPGPLTRSVEDAVVAFGAIDPACGDVAALFARVAGMAPSELRLAVCDEHFWDDCGPGIAECVKGALDELTAKGARLERLSLPEARQAREQSLCGGLFGAEGLSFIEEEYPDRLETLDPDVAARFESGRRIGAIEYITTLRKLGRLAAVANDKLRHVDALVTPTVAVPPPTVAEVAEIETYKAHLVSMTQNSHPVNLLELCAITLPAGLDAHGMPVGFQMIARGGQEERLLAAALACETVLGTARERLGTPPLCGG